MKRISISLILFAIMTAVFSQVNYHFETTLQSVTVAPKEGYSIINSEGMDGYTSEPGKPQLPYVIKRFVIPENARVSEIVISNLIQQKMEGSYWVYPSQPPMLVNGIQESEDFVFPDTTVYNSDRKYPEECFYQVSDELYFGHRIVTLQLYPVVYSPLQRELFLNSFDVVIEYTLEGLAENMQALQSKLRRTEERAFITSIIENKEDFLRFYPSLVQNARSLSAGNGMIEVNTESEIPDYILITCDSLQESFNSLVESKRKKGVYAIVKTVEEISKSYQGNDLAEQIRNYLKEARKRWGSSLYVVLGGDVEIVPTRLCQGIEGMCPADPYYANVDGNYSWNNNGNHIFGDAGDGVPRHAQNLNVGRIPVKNKWEVNNFIQKLFSYEKADGIMDDASYYKNRLIVGARLDDAVSNVGIMSGLYSFYTTYLKNYVTARFLFDEWNVGIDPLCNLLTKQSFLSALNNGIDSVKHFHIVYHMDHSGAQSMGTSSKKRIESIANKDVDQIKNGKFYQIVMSGGCHPANFRYDCIAEHFLNNPEGGAVAFIGNTDSGVSDEYVQYKNLENVLFSGTYNIGSLYRAASLFCSDYLGASDKTWRLHLLGDPQMPVWSDTPKRFGVNVTSQRDADGMYMITLTPRQPFPEGTYACLYKDGDIYHTEYVQNGEIRFSVSPKSEGILNLTLTCRNYIPYETSFSVESKNLNTLSVDTVFIHDTTASNVTGNGNGRLEAGETVLLNVKVKNTGAVSIPQLGAQVSCNYSGIILLSNTVNWGTINAGATATGQIRLQVHRDSVERLQSDPQAIRLSFSASDSNGKTYSVKDIKLDLYHSNLYAQRREVLSTSNGNLIIDPNDSVRMRIHLMNYGQGTASGLTATLQGSYISSSTVSYPNIEGHSEGVSVVPFSFKVSNAYRTGSSLPVTLKIQNQFGKTWQYSLNLTEKPDTISPRSLKYTCDEASIQVYWKYQSVFKGYNIFRSPVDENGNDLNRYEKLNVNPLTSAYYLDRDVAPLTRYYYKVTSLSATGAESDYSISISASTSFPSTGLFPVAVIDGVSDPRIDNSTFAADVDNDGYMELFTGVRYSVYNSLIQGNEIKSMLIAKDHNGTDLFDIDANVTTNSGFAEMWGEFGAYPAVTSLTKNGETLVFFANRGGSSGSSLYCYSFKDTNSDGKPDLRWEKKIPGASFIASVIADDLDGDGTKELLLRAETGSIYVYSVTKDNLYSFAPGNFYVDMAVADLDGDGKKEIIAGFQSNGVCIYRYDGTPFSVNPVFTKAGYSFHSTPVVCDLDNDGIKEILIMGRKESETAVCAFKPDGTPVPGWNGTQTSTCVVDAAWRNMNQNISVGDLDHDGNLEVVVPGMGNLKIWRSDGTLWNTITVEGLCKQQSPILADVDEDHTIEILMGVEERIYAFHPDGSNVKGFPLIMEDGTRATPCVADIDGDGKNEVVACSRSKMYVWKTPGSADGIEWGMDRHNICNTGEYACPARAIRENTAWDQPYYSCGDLVVASGVLTLNSGCTLRMSPDAGVVVRPGASLVLNGGRIENADVRIQKGASIQLLNNGNIVLRKGGFFDVQKGAAADCRSGAVTFAK